ncbi:Vps53-like protein [Thamnocephalis sphaerospora]|uniref:Vps53-like protein n=1 Tax=Thamnocephalis sphaerospora TaxID=78915 RepID=A0A4P9XSK7_9FUNG|nr:Vps53-like protein [Thamnocephalis sphaerospora]|eukprot:RKP09116.1 Vps53-like protein [Thamnocephalis sphaerospora]
MNPAGNVAPMAQMLSPELEEKLARLLVITDPLSAADVDLGEQLNLLFPNEASMRSADEVYQQTDAQLTTVNGEWKSALRRVEHVRDAEDAVTVEEARARVKDLGAKVLAIHASAERSERAALEMTADIKRLDTAKRNLTSTITVLRRLQMLGTAMGQLEEAIEGRSHREAAQLLEAVAQLFKQFEDFDRVDELSGMCEEHEAVRKRFSEQLFREFTECAWPTSSFNAQGALVQPKTMAQDICLVAVSLGEPFREKLVHWYAEAQLRDYRAIFCGSEEVSSLDGAPRRYTWFKRQLKTVEEEHGDIFPADWIIGTHLAHRFCEVTREDMKAVLSREAASDVPTMLKVLQLTLEFEQQLDRKFSDKSAAREALIGGETSESDSNGFAGGISAAFEPFLSHYIETINRTLSEMMNGYMSETVPTDEDSDVSVLASSTDLIYFFREAFSQCAKLSTGQPLAQLSGLFAKWLAVYANNVLGSKLPRERKVADRSGERIKIACVVLNTADYCQSTAEQLEEKFREKVDEEHRESISFSEQREPFLVIITNAVKTLVREIEMALEPALQRMLLLPWGTMTQTTAASEFATELAATLKAISAIIRGDLLNYRFFRTFCDRLAEAFIAQLDSWIMRIKRMSASGAKQLTDDLAVLRRTMLALPIANAKDENKTLSSIYTRIVEDGFGKMEAVLSLVQEPAADGIHFVDIYIGRVQNGTLGGLQRVLELKTPMPIRCVPNDQEEYCVSMAVEHSSLFSAGRAFPVTFRG